MLVGRHALRVSRASMPLCRGGALGMTRGGSVLTRQATFPLRCQAPAAVSVAAFPAARTFAWGIPVLQKFQETTKQPPKEDDVQQTDVRNVDPNPRLIKSDSSDQHEATKLSEDILTIPNTLTIMRLLSTPVLGYLVLVDQMPYALALLAASGLTDALDGYLARKYKSATVFGSIADPAADKALMTVMVGALAWRGLIPAPLVFLIIGRDVGLVMNTLWIRYQSMTAPKTFKRFWDVHSPSVQVTPTRLSKYNTFLQIVLVGICTLLASLDDRWRAWWAARDGLWVDTAVARATPARQVATLSESPVDAKYDQWGNYAKKMWHTFMGVVATTTVLSGASYFFGPAGARHLSRATKHGSKPAS